jgi:hypothetical protein
MSTRATYTFIDEHDTIHVYKHHDGYPTGALDAIGLAFPYAWTLPRFEADDFAAAFVAGNKVPSFLSDELAKALNALYSQAKVNNFDFGTVIHFNLNVETASYMVSPHSKGGGVRLIAETDIKEAVSGDCEYRYEIYAKNGVVYVKGIELYGDEKVLFDLPYDEAMVWAKMKEAEPDEDED